jgi:hypothetical protein
MGGDSSSTCSMIGVTVGISMVSAQLMLSSNSELAGRVVWSPDADQALLLALALSITPAGYFRAKVRSTTQLAFYLHITSPSDIADATTIKPN